MFEKIRKSIVTRFLVFMLGFVVVAVVIGSSVLAIFSYLEFRRTTVRDYQNIVKGAANEISMYIHQARRGLETLAFIVTYVQPASGGSEAARWKKDIALTAFSNINTQFNTLALISTSDHKVIALNSNSKPMAYHETRLYAQALEGETAVSGVHHSENNLPFVQIAVPIKRLGKIREVLWGELSLKAAWDVLESIHIGKNGYISVLDADGRYIAHREIKPVLMQLTYDKIDTLKKIRNTPKLADWIEKGDFCMAAHIFDLDWYVMLRQPISEIYGHIFKSLAWIGLLTIGICVLAALSGGRWVRRLLKPVKELHDQVQELGQGNLDQHVTITTEDEIGALGLEFNKMAVSLQEMVDAKLEAERKFQRAQHLALIGEAAGKVTHEVKNLINNHNLVLDILKKKALDRQGQQLIDLMRGDMDRLLTFSKDLLQFASRPQPKIISMRPEAAIEQSVTAQQAAALENGIELKFDWAGDLPEVPLDLAAMHTILNNLVQNSIDALVTSNGRQTITIAGRIENGWFCLSVTDSGPGIKADLLPNIFKPFVSDKGRNGSGLGLAIVYDLVKAQNGRIEYHQPPEGGAQFQLFFPLTMS